MMMFGEKLANVYPQGQLVSIVNTVNFRILVSILVISPFVGFLGIYLSHKIAGPLYRIERVIGNMAKGDLSEHITLRRGDEMVALADSINKLTDALTQDLVAEKASMGNVLKDLDNLKARALSCAPGDQAKINEVAENLTNEIKLISKSLDKYKV
jgi:methyl-accepting chemotaxis protein